MTQRHYVSAIARLRTLPEVFTGGDLSVVFGWRSSIASSYLAQWRKAGLIRSLGGRSDVHMNLVRNPQVAPELALRRAFPMAIKLGVDRLRAAGWTTQIVARPEVAIATGCTRYSVEGFDLVTRPTRWFAQVRPGTESTPAGVDSLRPAWVMADMLSRALDQRVRNAWLPDPEDLDFSALADPAVKSDVQAAAQALALAPEVFSAPEYARIYAQWLDSAKRKQ